MSAAKKKTPSANSGKSGRPGARPTNSTSPVAATPVTVRDWISGARLRTLGLAVAPVAIGVGASFVAAYELKISVSWLLAWLTLAVALFLQVGVNYANDYSDGIRGTDEFRKGPARLTGSGRVAPKKVLAVALTFFALAGIAGVAIVLLTAEYWLLGVGAAAIVAAWFYTGGKRPYGYFGLGEVFVFIFFGLVATLGTIYVQVGTVNQEAIFGAVAIGAIAVAVLLVNNLRDIDTDRLAKKRTLTVLLGKTFTKVLFIISLLVVPFGINFIMSIPYPVATLNWLVLLIAIPAIIITVMARNPKELIAALQLTSVTGLIYGLILGYSYAYEVIKLVA